MMYHMLNALDKSLLKIDFLHKNINERGDARTDNKLQF